MKLEFLCTDGSPLGVTCSSIYGDDGRIGVGGAELGLLTMCEAWHAAGHEVVLYNDPKCANGSPFEHRSIASFCPQDERDILIVFRTPNDRVIDAKGLRVWWSTDQYTSAKFEPFAPHVQKIVTISPFHSDYFKKEYSIHHAISIDLPVRIADYTVSMEKVPGRCIFTSVPDRGLQVMHACWPLIKRDCPEASLVITSDYRLWGVEDARNEVHRMRFAFYEDVQFLGAVPRRRLIEEQLKAVVHPYPNLYDELFCIAVAESQVAGVYPVTSDYGALRTTNMGTIIHGNPHDPQWVESFVAETIHSLRENQNIAELQQKAIQRFAPATILKQWDDLVFNQG